MIVSQRARDSPGTVERTLLTTVFDNNTVNQLWTFSIIDILSPVVSMQPESPGVYPLVADRKQMFHIVLRLRLSLEAFFFPCGLWTWTICFLLRGKTYEPTPNLPA